MAKARLSWRVDKSGGRGLNPNHILSRGGKRAAVVSWAEVEKKWYWYAMTGPRYNTAALNRFFVSPENAKADALAYIKKLPVEA